MSPRPILKAQLPVPTPLPPPSHPDTSSTVSIGGCSTSSPSTSTTSFWRKKQHHQPPASSSSSARVQTLTSSPTTSRSSSPAVHMAQYPKRASRGPSPHVHFPPTPGLVSSTVPVHSPGSYDRAPIAVSRNEYALPERDEGVKSSPPLTPLLERMCIADERDCNVEGKQRKGSYFHPRAFEACELEEEESSREERYPDPIPDLTVSSSTSASPSSCSPAENSDDSDVAFSPPLATALLQQSALNNGGEDARALLSFLPHAPEHKGDKNGSRTPTGTKRKSSRLRTRRTSDSATGTRKVERGQGWDTAPA